MSWFIPAVCACLSWGVGQTLIKKGLSSTPPFTMNLYWTIASFVFIVPYALIHGVGFVNFHWLLGLAALSALPNLILPYVLEKGNVSLSGTVLAVYPVITVLLSLLFLGEHLSFTNWFGIIFAITGTFLIGRPEKFRLRLEAWLVWGLFGALVVGLGDFIGKVGISLFDLYSFLFAYSLGTLFSLIVVGLATGQRVVFTRPGRDMLVSVAGNFLMQLGMLFFYIAMNLGQASRVSPVASIYPAITAVLAVWFLGEKINPLQSLGIISATAGVILLGI